MGFKWDLGFAKVLRLHQELDSMSAIKAPGLVLVEKGCATVSIVVAEEQQV